MIKKTTISALLLILMAFTARSQSTRELALPDVPGELRDVTSRANYIVLHFWDNMDFSDSEALADTDFMEQNFANYASIIPLTQVDSIMPLAADNILTRLITNPEAYNTMLELADIYLYDFASPLRLETAYLPFLEKALSDNIIDDATRIRLEFYHEEIKKNAPGTIIPDIEIITLDGKVTKISQQFPSSSYTLLYLFDPDCSHCTEIIDALNTEPIIQSAIQKQLLSILAIDLIGEHPVAEIRNLIPENWDIYIAADTEFNETEAFNLPMLPVIYLLDKDMIVILKEADPVRLLEKIQQIQN